MTACDEACRRKQSAAAQNKNFSLHESLLLQMSERKWLEFVFYFSLLSSYDEVESLVPVWWDFALSAQVNLIALHSVWIKILSELWKAAWKQSNTKPAGALIWSLISSTSAWPVWVKELQDFKLKRMKLLTVVVTELLKCRSSSSGVFIKANSFRSITILLLDERRFNSDLLSVGKPGWTTNRSVISTERPNCSWM